MSGHQYHVPTSRSITYREIRLVTERAQRIYRRTFEYMSDVFYRVGVINFVRCLGDQRELAIRIHEHVETQLQELHQTIRAEIGRRATISNDTFWSEQQAEEHDSEQRIRAGITSPQGAHYLQVILDLDRLLLLLAVSAAGGEEPQDTDKEAYRWQQTVGNCAAAIARYVKDMSPPPRKQPKG